MRLRYLIATAVVVVLIIALGCSDEDDRFVSGPTNVTTDTLFLSDTLVMYDSISTIDTVFVLDSIMQFVYDTTMVHDTAYLIMEIETPTLEYAFLALQAKTKAMIGKWGYYFYLTLDDVEVSGTNGAYEFRDGWFVLFNFQLCDRFFYKYNFDVTYISGDPRDVSSWNIAKPGELASGLSLSDDPPEWWPQSSPLPKVNASGGQTR